MSSCASNLVDNDLIQDLTGVRALIEQGFCLFNLADGRTDDRLDLKAFAETEPLDNPHDERARRWSLMGAAAKQVIPPAVWEQHRTHSDIFPGDLRLRWQRLNETLHRQTEPDDYATWSLRDGRTQADVLALLDAAILRVCREGAPPTKWTPPCRPYPHEENGWLMRVLDEADRVRTIVADSYTWVDPAIDAHCKKMSTAQCPDAVRFSLIGALRRVHRQDGMGLLQSRLYARLFKMFPKHIEAALLGQLKQEDALRMLDEVQDYFRFRLWENLAKALLGEAAYARLDPKHIEMALQGQFKGTEPSVLDEVQDYFRFRLLEQLAQVVTGEGRPIPLPKDQYLKKEEQHDTDEAPAE